LREGVSSSRAVLADTEALLRRYDYGAGGTEVPAEEYARLMAREAARHRVALRLTRYLLRRCATSAPFPTKPAGAAPLTP
jgi:hypothetical protein